jgi:2-oxoglutarate ferredoxin oxidoreductase subunit beta
LIHDAHTSNAAYSFLLSQMELLPGFPTPIGVLRSVEAPRYEDQMNRQIRETVAMRGAGDITKLLHDGDTWEVK